MSWFTANSPYASGRAMSRTLNWYIFKDLLKIFLMASGALAGIMSFGALLRPLTQNGLDGYQVLLLLRYFLPAMSTYSLPIAALFATTVVYGRMSADNEVTACRASGMSFVWLTFPAMVLGVLVAIASFYLLCFTVPNATQKGEAVVFSNLAKVIAHQIETTHQTGQDDFTVYAQDATLPPDNADHPNDQAVVLRGPLIMTYETPPGMPAYYHVAKSIWSASKATLHIRQNPDDFSAAITVDLDHGVTFPRDFIGTKTTEGGVDAAEFGPKVMPSPIGQKTKFMNIYELKNLQVNPSRGDQVKAVLVQFIKEDQAQAVIANLIAGLNGPATRCAMQASDSLYTVIATGSTHKMVGDALVITAGDKPIQFQRATSGQVRLSATGPSCKISVSADPDNDQAFVTLEMKDALVQSGDTATQAPQSAKFVIPLPPDIAAYKLRTYDQYLSGNIRDDKASEKLLFAKTDLVNHIIGELNARAAFVVSCLLLVLIGSSLGMMFRSGNFLTAFAVSVIPAMLSTVLIVTGQHTLESTPLHPLHDASPVALGTAIIWSGNVIICAGAVVLLVRLQRR
jgi:lipopolysaccharide export LptBFGC system permease protein LptF